MGIGQIQDMGTALSLDLQGVSEGTRIEFRTRNSTYQLTITDPRNLKGFLCKVGAKKAEPVEKYGSRTEANSATRLGWIFVGQHFVAGISFITSRIEGITIITKK